MKVLNPVEFLKKEFSEFYKKNFIKDPPEVEKREFGIGNFFEKIFKRHLSFSSYKELNSFLREEAPLYISFSGSYYEKPAATPMQNKKRIKADLYYEIDADDIATECKRQHDVWFCENCGAHGSGKPKLCIECSSKVSYQEWVCPECLKAAKKEFYKLIKILQNDFSFLENYSINFSGHKGYHIHIRSKKIQNLSKESRIELLDYVTLHNLSVEDITYKDNGLRLNIDSTIGRKIRNELLRIFDENNIELLTAITHCTYSKIKKILQQKQTLLESITNGILPNIPREKLFWYNLINHVLQHLSVKVDRQTSADLNKILRLPNSLHGGTGLLAKKLSIDELKHFMPLDDAIVFSNDEIKVAIKKTPKFYFNSAWHKFDNEIAYIEKSLAIYLISKHLAKPVC